VPTENLNPNVPMMEPTQKWNRSDDTNGLGTSEKRRILVQCQVSADPIVVVGAGLQYPAPAAVESRALSSLANASTWTNTSVGTKDRAMQDQPRAKQLRAEGPI
jgi:hypothetical protein